MVFAGLDPGGKKAFGVSAVSVLRDGIRSAVAYSAVLSTVDEAVAWVRRFGEIKAVGVDAPLMWATSTSGMRPQDLFLHKRFPEIRNSIQATNSLSGAASVQGPAASMRLKESLPNIIVTEIHPTATMRALGADATLLKRESKKNSMYLKHLVDWFLTAVGITPIRIDNRDALDSLVAAYVAWAGYSRQPGWQDLNQLEDCSKLIEPVGKVYYYFPL